MSDQISARLQVLEDKQDIAKTNGKAERFIQTSLREWAYAKSYPTSDHRAAALPTWLHRYNWHRPHGGINSATPISRLRLDQDNLLSLHIQSAAPMASGASGNASA